VLNSRIDKWCSPNTRYFKTNSKPSFHICLRADDLVDRYIMEDGRWKDCDKLVSPGLNPRNKAKMTYVDVGANIGSCALMLSAGGHTVYAFEPSEVNFRHLEANYRLNGFDTSLIFHAGIAAELGNATFFQEQGNTGNTLRIGGRPEEREVRLAHSASVSLANYDEVEGIPLVTLDDIVHEHIDVLKMDCQVCVVVVSRGCRARGAPETGPLKLPNRRIAAAVAACQTHHHATATLRSYANHHPP
jgi:FkbM family methyltransferase